MPKITAKTVAKILAVVVVYDTAVNAYNLLVVDPRYKKQLAFLRQQRDDMSTMAQLLAQRLDANGIDLDTFDVIAMDEIVSKYQS